MGLSQHDVANITAAWQANLAAVESKILEMKGFTWALYTTQVAPMGGGQFNQTCSQWYRNACSNRSVFWTDAIYFALGVRTTPATSPPQPWTLTNFEGDLTSFLLSRGPYAWLGYQWLGCGCGWGLNNGGAHIDCFAYPRPAELDMDYGLPQDQVCREVQPGVFHREYSKASVEFNCNTNTPKIEWKSRTSTRQRCLWGC